MTRRPPLDFDSGTGVLFIRNIPNNLRDHFKSYCYKRGKSMRQMIIKLIRDALLDETKVVLTGKKLKVYRHPEKDR